MMRLPHQPKNLRVDPSRAGQTRAMRGNAPDLATEVNQRAIRATDVLFRDRSEHLDTDLLSVFESGHEAVVT